MKILHIDASARTEGSYSRRLSSHFIDCLHENGLAITVDRLDLALHALRHFGALETAAITLPEAEHSAEMRQAIAPSDALVARVLAADGIVIGTPIYNFGMPSTLKAFFDHVSRNGKTFLADGTGMRGLLGDTRVAVLSATGGTYGPGDVFDGLDCLTPHIRAILGFLGVTDLSFVAAQSMMFAGPDAAAMSFEAAKAEAASLAKTWSTAWN